MLTIEEVVESFHDNQVMDYKEWLAKITEENSGAGGNTVILNFLRIWKPKIAILPGSFKPLHNGHYNILCKAERIFDKVILCEGTNPSKPIIERSGIPDSIREIRQVIKYQTTLPAFIDSLGYPVTLIRGLRNTTDLKYELKQLRYMQDFKEDINVINICCDRQFEHISSSDIRDMIRSFGTPHDDIRDMIRSFGTPHDGIPEESEDYKAMYDFREKVALKYLPFPISEYPSLFF